MNKILVAYFSVSGQTEKIANIIAAETGGALYDIQPVTPYTKADINWRNPESRASQEHNDPNLLPPIKTKVVGMEDYDVLFVGFPIWWGLAPNIVKTFLDSYGLDNKTIIPFGTSGGSGIAGAEKELKAICPKSVKWLPGKIFTANSDKAAVENWLETLDY